MSEIKKSERRLPLNMSPEVPGLLVINDFADVQGFEERKTKSIDNNQLTRATRLNVRILRTATLIDFVRAVEVVPDRGNLFLKHCNLGNPVVGLPD